MVNLSYLNALNTLHVCYNSRRYLILLCYTALCMANYELVYPSIHSFFQGILEACYSLMYHILGILKIFSSFQIFHHLIHFGHSVFVKVWCISVCNLPFILSVNTCLTLFWYVHFYFIHLCAVLYQSKTFYLCLPLLSKLHVGTATLGWRKHFVNMEAFS